MPRSTFLKCSGISLLLSTAVFGQVPALPRHPTQQQIIGYHLQQQRAWNLKQLPANSVLFKAAPKYASGFTYPIGWKGEDLPAYPTPYGFTIRQAPAGQKANYDYRNSTFLKNYLQRELPKLPYRPNSPYKETLGSTILRDILFPSLSYPR